MTNMIARVLVGTAALLALAACSEKPQPLGELKSDAASYAGTGLPYQAPGWKPGDKASWEQQLRTRGQGQNEYVKAH
jgi:hypothetical protein